MHSFIGTKNEFGLGALIDGGMTPGGAAQKEMDLLGEENGAAFSGLEILPRSPLEMKYSLEGYPLYWGRLNSSKQGIALDLK